METTSLLVKAGAWLSMLQKCNLAEVRWGRRCVESVSR